MNFQYFVKQRVFDRIGIGIFKNSCKLKLSANIWNFGDNSHQWSNDPSSAMLWMVTVSYVHRYLQTAQAATTLSIASTNSNWTNTLRNSLTSTMTQFFRLMLALVSLTATFSFSFSRSLHSSRSLQMSTSEDQILRRLDKWYDNKFLSSHGTDRLPKRMLFVWSEDLRIEFQLEQFLTGRNPT